MIQVKIDCREHEIIRICKHLIETVGYFKDLELVIESLPIGDFVFSNKETKEEIIIVERKTLQDLNSSIKDGRYEEQSFRLNGSTVHNHNIIYLIEGNMNHANMFKQRLDKKMLFSAMLSLNHYKGFSLTRTYDIDETAFFICNIGYKLKKGMQEKKEGFFKNTSKVQEKKEPVEEPLGELAENKDDNPNEQDEKQNKEEEIIQKDNNYCHVVKKVKKENVTPENMGEIMMSQIPGISSITAIAIMKEFKNISFMIENLKKEGVSCLQKIQYTNEKQQIKKLNKTVIANIMKYLQIES